MATQNAKSLRQQTDVALAERLQSILINAADGRRSVSDDDQYPRLRRELLRRGHDVAPSLLDTHPSVDSFSAYIRGVGEKPVRVQRVRAEFTPLFALLKDDPAIEVNPSAWTGISSRKERLIAVRSLIPLARAAVEGMIAALSDTGGNGAPPLDEKEAAIEHLRELHEALGELLTAAEHGHLDDELGQGFAAEAARFAKRAAHALRDDPMPYVASALLHGVLTACGLPGVGGFLGGIAQNIQKNTKPSVQDVTRYKPSES